MRRIALIASLAALCAAISWWPGYSAQAELAIAAVLAIASWAPTARRWYATAVSVTVAQSVLTTGAWMVLALTGASFALALRVASATVACAASATMAMRANRLAPRIPTACARR